MFILNTAPTDYIYFYVCPYLVLVESRKMTHDDVYFYFMP